MASGSATPRIGCPTAGSSDVNSQERATVAQGDRARQCRVLGAAAGASLAALVSGVSGSVVGVLLGGAVAGLEGAALGGKAGVGVGVCWGVLGGPLYRRVP